MRPLAPRVRLVLARGLVILGVVLAVVGVVGARWGLLVAALVLVGLGAVVGRPRNRSN